MWPNEDSGGRNESTKRTAWAKIVTVSNRDKFGFPSFWQLQAAGSIGFWLLALLCGLPSHGWQEFKQQTIFCATVFLASSLLRPVCRALYRRSLPWLALEAYAFGWSSALGAVAAFLSELVKLGAIDPIWPNFADEWLSFSVVLFLWCTLYFSIKQWQQTMREREQLSLHIVERLLLLPISRIARTSGMADRHFSGYRPTTQASGLRGRDFPQPGV